MRHCSRVFFTETRAVLTDSLNFFLSVWISSRYSMEIHTTDSNACSPKRGTVITLFSNLLLLQSISTTIPASIYLSITITSTSKSLNIETVQFPDPRNLNYQLSQSSTPRTSQISRTPRIFKHLNLQTFEPHIKSSSFQIFKPPSP